MVNTYCDFVCHHSPNGKSEVEQLKKVYNFLKRTGIKEPNRMTDDLRNLYRLQNKYLGNQSFNVSVHCRLGIGGSCDEIRKLRHSVIELGTVTSLMVIKYVLNGKNIKQLLEQTRGGFPREYKCIERLYHDNTRNIA